MQYLNFGNKRFLVLLPFMFALTACGGGGGGSSTTITQKGDDDGCAGDTEYRACGEVKDVQVVSDVNGNATVIWVEEKNENRLVQSSRYAPGNGWSGTERVSAYKSDVATELSNPEIATNSKGTVLAVFRIQTEKDDEVANQIVALPYYPDRTTEEDPDGGWERNGVGYVISDRNNDALAVANPDVAIEESGNGLAVWSSGDGSEQRIKASRFTADTEQNSDIQDDTRWGEPAVVGNGEKANGGTNPQVVIAPDGTALVVWRAGNKIRAVRFSANDDDFTAADIKNIGDGTNGSPSAPKIAIDANGDAAAIWEEGGLVMTSRYDASDSEWAAAEQLKSDISGDAFEPSIASNADGSMVAAWRVEENEIVVSEFTDGAWTTAIKAGDASTVNKVRNPEIAIATDDNALAVWSRAETEMDSQSIVSSRRVAGGKWSAPEAIESEGGNATLPKITIDGNGKGIAAWIQDDTNNDSKKKVRTNRF